MNTTPMANRLHIGIFGKRNSGKSTLINAMTNQNIALVSNEPGTTTDPVYKPIEIKPFGSCVLIDTAGFDDSGELGALRVARTEAVLPKVDVAVMIISDCNFEYEKKWIQKFKKYKTPYILCINNPKIPENVLTTKIKKELNMSPLLVNAKNKTNIDKIKEEIARVIPPDLQLPKITAGLVDKNDVVLLVMPQDKAAPKGRLILPQVQTIRELLDNECTVISCTDKNFKPSLDSLKKPPKLIITDSQVFKKIHDEKSDESMLTSFSVLFAAYKGDIDRFLQGAETIDTLTENDKILIAEACTHAPESEDIGKVKLPALLRKKAGENLKIDFTNGIDFPDNPKEYALIIHCGGCMFNRKYILSRIAKAGATPITNYGIAIAKLTGVLDKVTIQK